MLNYTVLLIAMFFPSHAHFYKLSKFLVHVCKSVNLIIEFSCNVNLNLTKCSIGYIKFKKNIHMGDIREQILNVSRTGDACMLP